MALSRKDVMPFGKHKGTLIDDIIKAKEAPYLLWLRKEKRKQHEEIFADDVNQILDVEVKKKENRQYACDPVGNKPAEPIKGLTTEPDRDESYSGQWGQF